MGHVEAGIALASLDEADVRAMNTGPRSQRLLGQPGAPAVALENAAEGLGQQLASHTDWKAGRPSRYLLQTIVSSRLRYNREATWTP